MNLSTAILLARRTLLTRPRRTLVLLLGYALGIAVMIALLAVGDALLLQARDRDLVAGGDLVLLPAGVDPDVLKTGAVTGMFLAVPNARFLVRQVLLGPRYASVIEAVSPEMTDKLIYVRTRRETFPARASAGLPSAAAQARSALAVSDPGWRQTPEDQAWLAPSWEPTLKAIDRFHAPPAGAGGRSWAEWWYFNFTMPNGTYGYVSFIADQAKRVRVSMVLRRPDGRVIRWEDASDRTVLPMAGAVYRAGAQQIELKKGVYHIRLSHAGTEVDLDVRPVPQLYFPPVEWVSGAFRSGYVVPALRATVTGVVRVDGETVRIQGTGYHDHNWGTWQAVTWEWGAASTPVFALLSGLIRHPAVQSPEMLVTLYAADAGRVGLLGTLRAAPPALSDWRPGPVVTGRRRAGVRVRIPGRLRYRAVNDARDRLDVEVVADDVLATPVGSVTFLQIWGRYTVEGRVGGRPVRFITRGFAETFVPTPASR